MRSAPVAVLAVLVALLAVGAPVSAADPPPAGALRAVAPAPPGLATSGLAAVPVAARGRGFGSRSGSRSRSRSQSRPGARRPIRRPSVRRAFNSILRALGIAYLLHLLFGWGAGGGSPFVLLLILGAIVWFATRRRRRRPLYY